jgi:ribosomal protein S18 acetylase RimI-like enzyme
MMRLGVMHLRRLIAVAAVDNDGAVALAVVEEFRRRGIANELVQILAERAAAIGYPPLHRYTAARARLAG